MSAQQLVVVQVVRSGERGEVADFRGDRSGQVVAAVAGGAADFECCELGEVAERGWAACLERPQVVLRLTSR